MDYKWQVLGISNVVKWITPGKGTLNRYVTPGSEFCCVENGWKWRRGGGYQLLYTVISKDVKNKTPINTEIVFASSALLHFFAWLILLSTILKPNEMV